MSLLYRHGELYVIRIEHRVYIYIWAPYRVHMAANHNSRQSRCLSTKRSWPDGHRLCPVSTWKPSTAAAAHTHTHTASLSQAHTDTHTYTQAGQARCVPPPFRLVVFPSPPPTPIVRKHWRNWWKGDSYEFLVSQPPSWAGLSLSLSLSLLRVTPTSSRADRPARLGPRPGPTISLSLFVTAAPH